MVTLQNMARAGGFIQSEANFARSRDEVVIKGGTGGAGKLLAGTVLGKITSTGKYVSSPQSGSDGSQISIGILFDEIDATEGDVVAVAILRSAEVRADDLIFDASVTDLAAQQIKWAQLAAVGIIVRA